MTEAHRRKRYTSTTLSLCCSVLFVLSCPLTFANDDLDDEDEVITNEEIAKGSFLFGGSKDDTFTINFNNVSIIEYIRFVSKITNLNFIFEDADLQFNVTIVSEEPITRKNIMSALMQELRIHNLSILEQDNNLIITRSKDVKQIATIVSMEHPSKDADQKAPIVTRVFRIKNASLTSIAAIIKPMMSTDALVELSNETRQLIVTDVTTNVDKIATLLASIDAPHTPLEVDTYRTRHINAAELISLATQIVMPFAEGNPIIFVPQPDSNTIFIVSTPYLIERTLTVLEDLDVSPKGTLAGQKPISNENVFIYKIQRRSGEDLINSLKHIAKELNASPSPPAKLVESLEHAKWIKDSNSVLFIADTDTLAKIKEILNELDSENITTSSTLPLSILLYKPKNTSKSHIETALKQLAEKLNSKNAIDQNIAKSIRSMSWLGALDSFLFQGNPDTLAKLQDLLATVDNENLGGNNQCNSFFLYKLQNVSGEVVEANLKKMAHDLAASCPTKTGLINSLKNVRWIKESNSLLLTGSPDTLDQVKQLIPQFDVAGAAPPPPSEKTSFLIYKPKIQEVPTIEASLKDVGKELQQSGLADVDLIQAIDSMRYVEATHSILFTGTPAALVKVQELLARIDVPSASAFEQPATPQKTGPSTFIIYNPKNLPGDELIAILCNFRDNLILSGVSDPNLYAAIDNLKWMDKTSTLLISGDENSVAKIQELLDRFDVASKGEKTENATIESIENTSFLVYKLQYHKGNDIQSALKQIAQDLSSTSTSVNQGLLNAINSLQWIQMTNSLLATGEQDILTKVNELIQNLDIPLRQVFIEVLVIQTTLNNTQNFGLQWGGKMQYMNKFAAASGNQPFPSPITNNTVAPVQNAILAPLAKINGTDRFPAAVTPPGISPQGDIPLSTTGFDLGVIGDIIMHKGRSFISLASLVNALQTDSDSTIVLNPKMITQDNNNSNIFVGQNIPYIGSVVTNNNVASTVTSSTSLEYRDVGLSLSITPILGNGDEITLDISNDLTSVTTNINGTGNGGVNGIQTTHASLNTKVHVPNNHFLILSGMINDQKNHFKSGIPCLGGLPVIGFAFSENDRQDTKNNIVIFIRPHIIESGEDYRKVTEFQENTYKDQAGLRVLAEEFDAGIDIVKTPENE